MDATSSANTPFSSGNGSAGESTLNKAAASAHGAVDRVAGAAENAVSKAKPAIDRVARTAHQTVDRVAGAAAPTAEWLSEQRDSFMASQRNAVDDAGKFVSAHPLKSLGIAVAAGFLIGRFIR